MPERRRTTRRPCRDHERLWGERYVDKDLKDDWLERLNRLNNFDLISICQGHNGSTRSRQLPGLNVRVKQEQRRQFGPEVCLRAFEQVLDQLPADDTRATCERKIKKSNQGRSHDDLVLMVDYLQTGRGGISEKIREDWFERTIQAIENADASFADFAAGTGETQRKASEPPKRSSVWRSAENRRPRLNGNWLERCSKVAEGPLFYPGCGRDLIDPIEAFGGMVDEIHFDDWWLPHQIPLGDPKLRGYQEIVSKSENSRWEKLQAKDWLSPSASQTRVYEKRAGRGESRPARIFTHPWEALECLDNLDRMAVFFYRGDSDGEGGSGLKWFGSEIFHKILDKLMPGGLIVTDGRFNRTHEDYWQNLPWMNLKDDQPNEDFLALDQEFVFLGRFGGHHRQEAVVWQVGSL